MFPFPGAYLRRLIVLLLLPLTAFCCACAEDDWECPGFDPGTYIPSYWAEELRQGAKEINTALMEAGSNKSAFLFYSDAHWNNNSGRSPALLNYLYEHTGMTKTIFGGDIVDTEGADYDDMSYLWEWRSMIKGLPNHHSVN